MFVTRLLISVLMFTPCVAPFGWAQKPGELSLNFQLGVSEPFRRDLNKDWRSRGLACMGGVGYHLREQIELIMTLGYSRSSFDSEFWESQHGFSATGSAQRVSSDATMILSLDGKMKLSTPPASANGFYLVVGSGVVLLDHPPLKLFNSPGLREIERGVSVRPVILAGIGADFAVRNEIDVFVEGLFQHVFGIDDSVDYSAGGQSSIQAVLLTFGLAYRVKSLSELF